jgi:predicted Zn-dependent peptidase
VLGTVESITEIPRTSIAGYYRRRYKPGNLVVAAAGNVDHAMLVRLVRKAFGAAGLLDGEPSFVPARGGGSGVPTRPGVTVVDRPTEQAHLVLGGPGLRRNDPRRFAMGVLNGALGGGMSSRLFQEVREKRGLAYSVYSYTNQHADTGEYGVYAGCQPKRVDEVIAICREQLQLAADQGMSDAELRRGKGQLRGSLVLGLEDTGSRMSRLGKGELVHGEIMRVDEILTCIDAVTLDDVRSVASDVLAGPMTLAVIGPFGDRDFSRAVA